MALNTKAEKTKQYIIESTASIFNKKGYAGTSLNDLMSATKLSKGCIYGNFENKDEIALAAFDYNKSRIAMSFIEKILQTENSIERLLVYPKVVRDFLTISAWDGGCPILNTSIESDDTHTPLKTKAATALSDWQKSIEKQIKRGIARKEIKEEANPKEIAVVIIFMIESAVMQTKVSGGTTELNIAMGFLEKLIQGLKA